MVSTAQHLTDLGAELSRRGHNVKVITSRRGYDDPSLLFEKVESYRDIEIRRISTLNLGKQSRWRRALQFASFILNCAARLLFTLRQDAVLALTSPPLISFLGALFTKLKGGRFYFWAMDLNPDEAIAAGWLKENSIVARLLNALLNFSMKKAEKIFVLDRFMRDRLIAKGIPIEKLMVMPPWSHDDAVRFDAEGRRAFRLRHALAEKFVVMYSGNHSPCHPLDTLLAAAEQLRDNPRISFCFVGGGSEKTKVERFARDHALANVRLLPYQPLAEVSASLSAADLQVVVMGDPFVGIVHPCKLYNILRVGAPVLYIGPAESHVTDLLSRSFEIEHYQARHGGVESLVEQIRVAFTRWEKQAPSRRVPGLADRFSPLVLMPKIIDVLVADPFIAIAPSAESQVRIA